jgi:hypothetical protein
VTEQVSTSPPAPNLTIQLQQALLVFVLPSPASFGLPRLCEGKRLSNQLACWRCLGAANYKPFIETAAQMSFDCDLLELLNVLVCDPHKTREQIRYMSTRDYNNQPSIRQGLRATSMNPGRAEPRALV